MTAVVAVTMTVHNRREKTIRSLQHLREQSGNGEVFKLRIHVVDDGSTDGTTEAVMSEIGDDLDVRVHPGNGGLYWAGGMNLCQRIAQREPFDYLLWLNDDVDLNSGAMLALLGAFAGDTRQIVVAATTDGRRVTYTGSRRRSRRPTDLETVDPNGEVQEIDAFNGNIVLVGAEAFSALGPVDSRYRHAYGDNDYGLRAKREGVPVFLLPEPGGHCERNSLSGTWSDSSLPRLGRIRKLLAPTGLPMKSHFRYNMRHAGPWRGFIFAIGTYVRVGARIARGL